MIELETLKPGGVGHVVLRRGPHGHAVLRDRIDRMGRDEQESYAERIGTFMAIYGFPTTYLVRLTEFASGLYNENPGHTGPTAMLEAYTALVTYECQCPNHMN